MTAVLSSTVMVSRSLSNTFPVHSGPNMSANVSKRHSWKWALSTFMGGTKTVDVQKCQDEILEYYFFLFFFCLMTLILNFKICYHFCMFFVYVDYFKQINIDIHIRYEMHFKLKLVFKNRTTLNGFTCVYNKFY